MGYICARYTQEDDCSATHYPKTHSGKTTPGAVHVHHAPLATIDEEAPDDALAAPVAEAASVALAGPERPEDAGVVRRATARAAAKVARRREPAKLGCARCKKSPSGCSRCKRWVTEAVASV